MVAEAKGARDSAAGTQCVAPHNCKGEVQGQKVILGDLSPSWPDLRRDRFPALPRGGEGAPRNSHPSPFLLSRESLNSSLRIPGRVLSPEERPGDQSRPRERWLRRRKRTKTLAERSNSVLGNIVLRCRRMPPRNHLPDESHERFLFFSPTGFRTSVPPYVHMWHSC